MDKYVNLITLSLIPGVGPKTILSIMENNDLNIIETNQLYEYAVSNNLLNQNFDKDEFNKIINRAKLIFDKSLNENITIIDINDPEYPQSFKKLKNYPAFFFAKGNTKLLNSNKNIAVVGSREPTQFAEKHGFYLTQALVDFGFHIVSGLALGCDTIAHTACLESQGNTISVLAHGLDQIYPAKNKKLAQQILDANGCLISEYEYGKKPQTYFFTHRNRLQAGLSSAMVVIETKINGGTIVSVKYANSLKIPVACITGHSEKYRNDIKIQGNIALIKEGAFAIKSREDIGKFVNMIPPFPI